MTREQLLAAIQELPPGGSRIRVAMTLTKRRQRQIARKLRVSQSTFSLIANDQRPTSESEQAVIAVALGLEVSDLFGESVAA